MSLYEELARAARRTMLGQISVTDRLIRQLYIRAAKSIARQIESAKAGSLTERWLTAYRAELEREIGQLGRGIYGAIVDGAQKAAEARAECDAEYLRRAAAMARVDDSFVSTLSNVPTEALRAMIERRLYTDGRMLSRRIWSATGRLEGNISEILQQAVAQKMDALTLARHLEAYVNPRAACPVSWHKLYPDIPFDRRADYNALRLARTAITHAQWAAGKAAAKKNPLCKGMKWNLSNQHYERQIEPWGEDVCDEYARHDEGLGKGVYPVDSLPMPHPQCLCYQTEVVPTLEDAAELLASSEAITDAERRRTAWARGGLHDAALDADYERWRQEKLASALDNSGENGTINVDGIAIPHSLGAKARNYKVLLPDGSYTTFAEGTRITNVKVIAGKGRDRQIDEIDNLVERFGGNPFEWQKKKGIGYIEYYGESMRAEVHWYEEPEVGAVKFKLKELLEE